jgi:hypothetical protein
MPRFKVIGFLTFQVLCKLYAFISLQEGHQCYLS